MASAFKFLFFCAALAVVLVAASGVQFQVGEKIGWRKPTGKEHETYNEWAGKNRFRVGDALYFKYKKDSVLEVSAADYLTCNTSNPISEFDDGSTVFQLGRPGFFYFISGKPGHCEGGQKLIVRVMHPSEVEPPVLAPSPGGGSDGSDLIPPSANSTTRLSVISIFMAALGGLVVVLCLMIVA